jgi:uncharacterized Zn-binding protein involved in type VI secretion
MGKPAARLGDMHTCPMVTPATPPIPHVGGPILPPCVPTVLIGNLPAAVVGNMAMCVGPPDSIILGSTGVFIMGKPAARMGDTTAHGGVITVGYPTVLIGESGSVTVQQKQVLIKAAQSGTPFCEPCQRAQAARAAAQQAAQKEKLQKAADRGIPFCEQCAH